ncbi:MAG: ribosome silencing factor [Acidimicrobiales bacterium]
MSTELVALAVEAAAAKTPEPTVVIEVGDLLAITEYFVITSGSNDRQVRAIAEEIERLIKQDPHGRGPRMIEGRDDARWVLMDYGDFVVHVFLEEARKFYDLERLWGDAPRLDVPVRAEA